MARRIPRDRDARPNPDIRQEWSALFAPFVAPNGLVVEAVSSVEEMLALGDHFHNALEMRFCAEAWARQAAKGDRHVYRVMAGSVPQSCGELVVKDGAVEVQWDRAQDNGPGTPETGAAVAALVGGVNAGTVPVAYAVTEDGFEPFAAAGPTP